MAKVSNIQSAKDLPDTGITENEIQYGNYVYTKDGKIGVALKKHGKGNATAYGVEFHCSGSHNEVVEVIGSELTLVPSSPIFDNYIQNLNIISVLDADGTRTQDERVNELMNDLGIEFDDQDIICYCPFSGTYFELDSKTGHYHCIAGNEVISTSSLREGAKLAFEWAITENGLLDPNSEFLKHLADKYTSVGVDAYLINRIIENVEFHFDVKAVEVSSTEFSQSGSFIDKATQSIILKSNDGTKAVHTLIVEIEPSTFTILIQLDGDLVSFTPVESSCTGDEFTRQLQRLATFDALKYMKAK